jgi:cystathionine gamma-synthase
MKFNTTAVHAGTKKEGPYNSVITPIYPSSTFSFDKIGVDKGYDYTRSGNPTRRALEENLAALEGAPWALATATGMAATTTALHLLKPGDRVVVGQEVYGGTYRIMTKVFSQWGVRFDFVDMRDAAALEEILKEPAAMVWAETPSNPLLNLTDLKALAHLSKRAGAILVVDNTFMTPYFQKPFELGADVVVHSTTKYINGHSDVVGGVVMAKDPTLIQRLAFLGNALGVGEAPLDSWLVLRGVKTLGVRMEAHQRNALKIAHFLEGHPSVARVYYPGLPSHPQHTLAQEQMSGFGGMLSFEFAQEGADLDGFFGALKLPSLAVSLGGVESLIEAPWHMSHLAMDPEHKLAAGIKPSLIRLSVGIEAADDLIQDLAAAMKSAGI